MICNYINYIGSHTAMMMPQVPMPTAAVPNSAQLAATQQALITQQATLMVRTSTFGYYS